jgi:hypothetical protein
MALRSTPYTYLLGLYLGDGYLVTFPRGVYKLRITCANRYRGLIRQCELAMGQVLPNKVNRVAGAQLGERHPLPALPLQQQVPRHPRELRRGVRRAGDRVAAAQPLEPVGGQAGSVALLDAFVGPKR